MSIESSAPGRLYFPNINLLRAFAALSVLVYHVIEIGGWTAFPQTGPLAWFRLGWMSVDLFFVISGFVIAWALLTLQAQSLPAPEIGRRFLLRRFGRLAPLYYLTAIVYLATFHPAYTISQRSGLDLYLHATFLHSWTAWSFGSINGINWSISVEMQFYLFMLLTLPWWSKRRPVTVLATGIAIAWALRAAVVWAGQVRGWSGSEPLFYWVVQMPTMLDEFACGIAMALLIRRHPPGCWPGTNRQQALWLGSAALVIAFVTFAIFLPNRSYWDHPAMVIFWRTALGLTFAILLAIAIRLPAPASSPLYRVGYYLGDISYGIYLWHLIVIEALKRSGLTDPLQLLLATLAISLPVASISWHMIEKPCINWAKRRTR